jgi:hypothetical protein
MIKKILLVLAALLAVLVIVILNQPDDFSVSRSTTIAASPATVHAQVNDFRKWESWSPWAKLDPNSKAHFEGAPTGQGAIFKWSGNNEVGEGKQEIVESKPGEMVRIKIDFIKPFEGSNDVEFSFIPEGSVTLVTWSMSGKNNFIGKCISLVMDCETLIGPMFEQGLANLKAVAESSAKQ